MGRLLDQVIVCMYVCMCVCVCVCVCRVCVCVPHCVCRFRCLKTNVSSNVNTCNVLTHVQQHDDVIFARALFCPKCEVIL